MPDDEAKQQKEAEKKIRAALRAKAVEVHPKGTLDDIKRKIDKVRTPEEGKKGK